MAGAFAGKIGRYFDESEPHWTSDQVRAPAGAPNVLMVVLDDVGFAQLGCYGSDIETPTFDRLAETGLQFTNFHTTAVCSATRACLLTGRNHHRNAMGRVIEVASGFPGYNARIPAENGFLSQALVAAGYATFAIGKWHLTPDDECHAAAPRTRWPLARGFERFYGFMNGETHQHVPALIEDNRPLTIDRLTDGYHLTEDLADKAIGCIRDLKVIDPDKPFFCYFATGACHSPHQVSREWSGRYEGRYAEGWDRAREAILARQVASRVMPAGTTLTERPEWVPAWDSLSEREQYLYQRFMEVFAGFLSHTDAQVGRIVTFLEEIGELDRTMILVLSDNGASSEGGPRGTTMAGWNRAAALSLDQVIDRIDEIGTARSFPNYPWGWTLAGNTPFQRWKREVHEGGIADPLLVSWPQRLGRVPGMRRQYLHAVDLMPTILDLAGIEVPEELDHLRQAPLDGISLAPAWLDPDSTVGRRTQYYEMFGNRALYHDGWKLVSAHPYVTTEQHFDDDVWELYHVAVDQAECHDLAAERPDKVRELLERWWIEAGENQVLPLDNRPISDFVTNRPHAIPPRRRYVYLPGATQVPEAVAVNVKNRPHRIDAEVEIPPGAEVNGVLLAQGSLFGGWVFYVHRGRLSYTHNFGGVELAGARADQPLPEGPHVVSFEFVKTDEDGGEAVLSVDRQEVARGPIPHFTPVRFSATGAGLTCGYSTGLPVTDEIEAPGRFTGTLRRVIVTVDGEPHRDPEAEARIAISSQ